ncbi:MAG: class I SAM-dependent methyltransferase [Ignavibacteriales bacterium CG_4_9_14_3_um_filter_30_11]|nr:MAG: class I SAM-dependent methyltransferase [Ignavibacteriales bacterium CG_4_9_14_3_um_filter_30_11]
MAEWFESWFESEEYLNVYKHRDEKEARLLVESILSITKIREKSKILDLACGAGRHSIEFAKKGFELTAVDLSKNLLDAAKKNAEAINIKVNFIRADLRKFKSNEKFDLVLNLFTSFGYFNNDEDNFKVFKTAYHHLMDNGFFIFDYLNKNHLERNLISETVNSFENVEIIQKRKIIDGRVIKEIVIKKNGNEKIFNESVKIYSKEELLENLEKLGFKILNIFGSFDKTEFDKNLSDRIIIIAQK